MRKFGVFAFFPIVVPLVGLGMVLRALRRDGLAARRLLKLGRLAFGTLVHKKATGAQFDKQPVYELTYELTTATEPHRSGYRQNAKEATEGHRTTRKTHQLASSREHPLLFDPDDPRWVYPIDDLPGHVTVTAAGRVEAPPSSSTLSPCR